MCCTSLLGERYSELTLYYLERFGILAKQLSSVHVKHRECILQVLHHLVGVHALSVQLNELVQADAPVIVTVHLELNMLFHLLLNAPVIVTVHLELNTLVNLIRCGSSSTLSASVHVHTPHHFEDTKLDIISSTKEPIMYPTNRRAPVCLRRWFGGVRRCCRCVRVDVAAWAELLVAKGG
ncbi:hypothetical protein LR48_Vigan07g201900 [Vigna angularis]|uniref:Uncharacterized protein n=1 Tax=Phaseolus angularis TaxID=3914 RepID=A0A0L9UZL7_PHAAN|nr:hypothetical protein LR48_Vigan07g201900 [Vigna angularis]